VSEINTVTFDLEINVTETEAEIRKLQGLVQGYTSLLLRCGLPAEAAALLRQVQQIEQAFNSARRAALAFQAARMAAGDPLAWAQFGLQAGLFVADVFDVVEARRPRP